MPIDRSWKSNTEDKDDITFLSVNTNSPAHWSRESNKAEHLKHIFEKYRIDSAEFQEVYMNWAQLPTFKSLAQIP